MSAEAQTPTPPPVDAAREATFLRDHGRQDGPAYLRAFLACVCAGAAALMGWLLVQAPGRPPLLPTLVAQRLEDSGASNPVTAVLLNFRAYDTLLETAVLVVAMAAVWSMDRGSRKLARESGERMDDPVIQALTRLIVPLAGVTAVYLTWAGSHRPGGAFQSGALIAGAGVLLVVAGFLRPPTAAARLVRFIAAFGICFFVAVGAAVIPWTGRFLEYPSGWAYGLILAVETVLTAMIAVVLVELFVDVPSLPDPDPSLAELDPTGDPLGRILDIEGRLVPGRGKETS